MKTIILSAALFLFTLTTRAQSSKGTHMETKSTSISITNSDDNYALFAYFASNETGDVETLITNQLGKPGQVSASVKSWKLDDVYTVNLKSGKLTISLDKGQASASLIAGFADLGKAVEKALSGITPAPPATQNR